jgi:hypothetical protein
MGEREIARYYTLSDKDLQIIRQHRRDHNRLGFSIQLCHLRFPGWPLKAGAAPSPQLLAYVAQQLNVSPELVHDYSRDRDTTRREHLLELQRDFGFQPFTEGLSSKLADLLLPDALRSPKPMPLITALLEQMRAQKIIVPAFSTVENLAWEILARAETKIFVWFGPRRARGLFAPGCLLAQEFAQSRIFTAQTLTLLGDPRQFFRKTLEVLHRQPLWPRGAGALAM